MNLKEKMDKIRMVFAEKREKADDLELLMGEIMKLPYGQLKKVLTAEVMTVLEKYGYGEAA